MATRRREDLQDEIAQQASEFVVHLYSGSMSAKDEQRLREWLDADEAHRVEYQRMLDLWADSSDLNLDAAGLVGADETHMRRRWLLAASVAIIAVGAGLFGWLSRDIPPIEDVKFATAVGEQRTISLADGSTVYFEHRLGDHRPIFRRSPRSEARQGRSILRCYRGPGEAIQCQR